VDLSDLGCSSSACATPLKARSSRPGHPAGHGAAGAEAENGRTIWSERFTGTTEDVFELQDEIAARVAGAIEPTLMLAEAGRSPGQADRGHGGL
jgi:hypothetical protein